MAHINYPVTAIRHDGYTIVAATPEEAASFHNLRPGNKHVERYSIFGWTFQEDAVRYYDWILRDALGKVVQVEDLPDSPRCRPYWEQRTKAHRRAAEMGLPIPGTGHRFRGRYYRGYNTNIAARAEEAALDADLKEWGVYDFNVGRRRNKKLPQIYDDVGHRNYDRNWKRNRRTRWKAGPA